VEQFWNGFGTVLERFWNGSGTVKQTIKGFGNLKENIFTHFVFV